jgi:hypothetical protein
MIRPTTPFPSATLKSTIGIDKPRQYMLGLKNNDKRAIADDFTICV